MQPLRVVQNGYVVRNLEEGCARMNRLYGIGPFVGRSTVTTGPHMYRGEAAPPIVFRLAFAQSGDLNIELIEPISTSPSALHDDLALGKYGLHHVAIFCDDYARERDGMVAQGFPIASEFHLHADISACFIDTRAALGHMTELYPRDPGIVEMYDRTRMAARDWDGKQLFKPRDLQGPGIATGRMP